MCAALREQPGERDEPRIDDERLRLTVLERRARQAERILDGQADGLERVAAAGNHAQLISPGEAAPADSVQIDSALGDPAGPLVCDKRRRWQRTGGGQLEVDANIVSFDDVARRAVPANVRR